MYVEMRSILNMRPGAVRRKRLLAWFQAGTAEAEARAIPVNCKYFPQMHQDTDLSQLVKKGVLVRKRENCTGRSGRPKALQLNEGTSKPAIYKDSGKRRTSLVLSKQGQIHL